MVLLLSSFRSLSFRFNRSTIQPFNSCLIFFILSFSPLIEGGTTYYPVAIIQIVLLIILVSGTVSSYQEERFLSLKSPPFYAILLFLTYSIIIAFLTPYNLPAFQQIQLLFFYCILFYFSAYFHLKNVQFQMWVVNILVAMGLFEAVCGIGQSVFYHQRARGTFFNPDYFGEYLAIIFCIVLGLLFDKRVAILYPSPYPSPTTVIPLLRWEGIKRRVKELYRWIGASTLLILGAGIILSQSRGAALAWSVGVSVILWKRFRYKIAYVWLALFLLFIVIPNPLQHRILNDYREDPYSLSRFEMWKEAIHIIQDHPMGIGLEMFPLISPQYAFPIIKGIQHYSKVAESPHNDYLRLFAELGVTGGLFFMGSLFFFYFKWIDKGNNSFTKSGILSGTLVFLTHSLVDSNFHEPALVITVLIISTLLLDKRLFQLTTLVKSEKLNVKSKVVLCFLLLAFCFLLAFLIIKPTTGWFYYSKGYTQIKNHQDDDAQINYKKAIFWENQNARYHNALANAYFNTFQKTNYYGWIFKALEELNQALKFNPIDGNYFKLKGEIYQTLAVRERNTAQIQELLEDAFTNYKEALKLLPYDVSLYVALGSIEEASGKTEDAEELYGQATLIEPNYLFAWEKKIELLVKTGRKEAALRNYQDLNILNEQLTKRASSDSEKSFVYFNHEKLKKAVEKLKDG